MITDLFTFGCSFTKDAYQDTWADLLATHFGLVLHNRAERGAGANFISKRILASHDMDPDTSLVAIMWPCADRFDLWADHTVPHLVDDQTRASWADGMHPVLIDLEGRRRQDEGFILNGSIPRGYKHYWYKFFYSPHQAVHDWYAWIIQTQLFLKNRGYQAIMMSGFPLTNPLHCHPGEFIINKNIFNLIDLESFVGPCTDSGFQTWCYENELGFLDAHHPNSRAHKSWLENFVFDPVEKIIAQQNKNK